MSDALRLVDHPLVHTLGWSLLHFLWQGALVGLAAFVVLRVVRPVQASTRYLLGVAALLALFLAPVATFLVLTSDPIEPSAVSSASRGPGAGGFGGSVTGSIIADAAANPAVTRQLLPSASGRLGRTSAPPIAPIWLPLITAIWTLGVMILSLRLLGGWLLTRSLARGAVGSVSRDLEEAARDIARRLELRRGVAILQSAAVAVPTLVGWVRPVVLLPVSALSGLSALQLEAILAHELAHVRRHDYLINLLQSVVETLLFYHPAVWWVSSEVRAERENCCDDLAVAVCGDRLVYVSALAELTSMERRAFALAATDGALLTRVRRILGRPVDSPRELPPSWGILALVALLGGGAGTYEVTTAAANDQPTSERQTTGERATREETERRLALEADSTVDQDEQRRADQERRRADAERRRADEDRRRADEARRRSDEARLHNERQMRVVEERRRVREEQVRFREVARREIEAQRRAIRDAMRARDEALRRQRHLQPLAPMPPLPPSPPTPTLQVPSEPPAVPEWPAPAAPPAPATPPVLAVPPGPPALAPPPAPPAPWVPPALSAPPAPPTPSAPRALSVPPPPPAPPAPPAPSAPPAPPFPSKSQGNLSWSDGTDRISITWTGTFRLSDDERDISFVEPGAVVTISDGAVSSDRIELRGVAGGMIERSYYRNRSKREFDADARALFERALIRLIRSGMFASERVARFLKQGGPDAVLAEIDRLQSGSSHVNRLYYSALLKQADLAPAVLTRILDRVASDITSDHEKGLLLISALQQGRLADEQRLAVVRASRSISSDHEQGNVLTSLMAAPATSAAVANAAIEAAGSIGSSHERSRVLALVAARPTLSEGTMAALLGAASSIASSHERSMLLLAILKTHTLSPAARQLFLEAAKGISSTSEQNRVLAELVRSEGRVR